jgi:hypothetical protein
MDPDPEFLFNPDPDPVLICLKSKILVYLIPMCSPVAADGGIRGLSVLADGRLALLVSRLYLYGSPSSPKFMANLL